MAVHHLPGPCARCGVPLTTDDEWVLGHIKSRVAYPELTWDPTNWQIECPPCSSRASHEALREAGAREALARLAAVEAETGQAGLFPATGLTRDQPGSPVSLPGGSTRPRLGQTRETAGAREPLPIPPDLVWDPDRLAEYPWIVPYLDLPPEATPPLAMTPPQPGTTGSYGPELITWAAETLGVTVRWWQGLAIVRILEHRADGSLCWEEVVKSASRRSGKSVIVRLLAVWRLVFAPALFGEEQLIVHSASTLKIAKEPMRYAARTASRWTESPERYEVYTNNNNYAIEDKVGGHRWFVVPPDKTAGLDTCMGIVDEAWKCPPEIVDDDLEPSLLERVSPQLLLISTAHRRATSLMRGRVAGALAGEGMDRVLILLWAAQPDQDPGSVETWRAASPHWTPEREAYLRRKYEKALRGEQDPEFDDPDPMEGFRCQYLNLWPLGAGAMVRGAPLTNTAAWGDLVAELPDRLPDGAAIETWFATGASLALAWRLPDGAAVVRVVPGDDVATVVAIARSLGVTGVTVGKSIAADPALAGLKITAATGTAISAVSGLTRLLTEGQLAHDGSEHLGGQVLAVRTIEGTDGPRLTSQARTDAIKAANWAATIARGSTPKRSRVRRMMTAT